jgi:hypothetical protein
VLYFSQLSEDKGNPSVACHPAYQVAATEEVDLGLAAGIFAHTADKANRGKIAKVDNILPREKEACSDPWRLTTTSYTTPSPAITVKFKISLPASKQIYASCKSWG